MTADRVHEESILFITLDSCRFDTFEAAACPALRSVGPLHRAMAPANFTYASHMAMFVGFTPGVAGLREPFVNPKFAKVFKMVGTSISAKGREFITLQGRSIVAGLRKRGYRTVGTGAAKWFDDATPAGRDLTRDFDRYWYAGNTWSLPRQIEWAQGYLRKYRRRPVFLFINVGETHVPYYHEGAAWDRSYNPCVPFKDEQNDAAECRRRQRACLEFVDRQLAPVIEAFREASTLICGDHGDCWGEDGLWEHGIHHPKVLEVPLLLRLRMA